MYITVDKIYIYTYNKTNPVYYLHFSDGQIIKSIDRNGGNIVVIHVQGIRDDWAVDKDVAK